MIYIHAENATTKRIFYFGGPALKLRGDQFAAAASRATELAVCTASG
jgi:hypothetical protein